MPNRLLVGRSLLAQFVVALALWTGGPHPAHCLGGSVEGFAEPFRHIEISASGEPGRITQVLVKEGQAVAQGDLLVTLDTSVLEASLEIARRRSEFSGRLRAAEAELALRGERAAKLESLRAKGHASPAEMERANADLAVAKAQVLLAEEERTLAELECLRIQAQIERRKFTSPIDGIVTDVARDQGESAEISNPRLLTLVQLNPLRVKFPVSVQQSHEFQVDDKVAIELPEFGATATGTVEIVAPVLDAKSGTVLITCVIENDDNQYRSGMRCLLNTQSSPQPVDLSGSSRRRSSGP